MSKPPELARRMQSIAPSATAEIFKRVAELRAQGVAIVSLSVGEPDFEPPLHVRDAAKRALDTGPFGYTSVAGLAELREAICERSAVRRGVKHAPNEVVVGAGAKHALFNLAQALYEPGDEVLIPTPSWVSYAEQANLCGATPVLLPCDARDDFLLTPSALAAAFTPRTKALVLCSPSNPTGFTYSAAQLRALADVLKQRSIWVIVDEIYAELCYGDAGAAGSAPSLLSVAHELREQLVIVDGVSKSYAMTGFRVGWLLAPPALARACEIVQSQATTSVATVAQLAAIAALRGDQTCVKQMRDTYAARRDHIVQGLAAIPGVACGTPTGAFYALADVRALLGKKLAGVPLATDLDFARALLDRERVAVVPGSAFHAPGYLRLSYAASNADIDAALARLASLVASLS
jgi:aspartate aminotransferase